MFSSWRKLTSTSNGLNRFLKGSRARCDVEDADDLSGRIEQADAELEKQKSGMKAPMHLDHLKLVLAGNAVQTFDGFRANVAKQINLNTSVTQMFWMGSQAIGGPLYQYRFILHDEDKMLSCATDCDFNAELELKITPVKSFPLKSNASLNDNQNSFSVEIDHCTDLASHQLGFAKATNSNFQYSFMHSVMPKVALGGKCQYVLDKDAVRLGFAGIYDDGEHFVAGLYDTKFRVLYQRKVNPNRVHLAADFLIDEKNNYQATVGAEFMLKQSKINMSVDSDLTIKSVIETTAAPGLSLSLAAETQHASDHYRFGAGVSFG